MDARLRRRRDQLGRIGILLERAMFSATVPSSSSTSCGR